jgi:uncharacterized protein (TIGR02246 family)
MRIALLFAAFLVSTIQALAQDKAAIEKLNESFSAALDKGDIATVAEMSAEDAFLLPAGSRMERGRSAIKSFWEKASDSIGNMKLVTVDVKPLGADAVREVGTFSLRTKGSQPQEVTGKYVVIWQKTGSGWKLATDIWNADK